MMIWIDPDRCDPPHRVSHGDKLVDLANEFVERGWGENYPALIGYMLEGRLQLLSGTHRHKAAEMAGIRLPVIVRDYDDVSRAWGTEAWADIMDAPSVRLLTLESAAKLGLS